MTADPTRPSGPPDDGPDLGDIAAAEEYGRRIRATPSAEVGAHIRQRLQSGTMPVRRVRVGLCWCGQPETLARVQTADGHVHLGPPMLARTAEITVNAPGVPGLRQAIADVLDECRVLIPDAQADAVLAVVQPCLDRLVDYAAEMEQRVIDLGQHREVAERARAEVDRLTALVGRYADRAVANGQRAEQTEAALARVRAAVAERRAEVAEYEAEHPPSAWSDAVTVTCDRIDDALRPQAEPQGIHDTEGQPTTEETSGVGPLA